MTRTRDEVARSPVLRVGSLCSGIEGFGRGLEEAGMELSFLCENNPQAQSILRRHHPTVPLYDDITTLDGTELSPIDVLIAGTPCTDLSISGKRAGLDGSQSRLFYEFIRVLGETRPEWFIWENVVGLLSSHAGRDMETALGCMADSGYGVSYRVLNAADLGVPQRRRRVIVVGHLGDGAGAAEVLFESESGGGDPPAGRQAPSEVASLAAHRARGRRDPVAALTATGVGTCGADDNQAQAGHVISTLQGSQTGRWSAEGASGGQLIPFGVGDMANCLTAKNRRFDPNGETFIAETVPALTARCGNTQDDQQLGQLVPIAFHVTQDPISSESVFPAMGTGNAQGCGTMGVAIPIDIRNATRRDNSTGAGTAGTGIGEDGDPSYAVTPAPSPYVAFSENQRAEVIEHDVVHQLTGGGGKPGQGYPAVRQDMAVRRLTPLECERLMGLPDGWTEYGVNEAGVTVKVPDTHRYRCIGNSVAVPMSAWVARRLVAVDAALHADEEMAA